LEKMGILGPRGTHSEAAALYFAKMQKEMLEPILYADIFEALSAMEEGKVESAFVPVENSLEGAINVTLDFLAEAKDVEVTEELIWPVHNQLMGKGNAVEKIYSHAQPISQCRDFLREHYPAAEIIKVASTAKAAQMVGELSANSKAAAICSRRAGEIFGLKPIAAEIQDSSANCTRFFRVRKAQEIMPRRDGRALVICQLEGSKSGSLYEVLGELAKRSVNMTRIESRPARTELGVYIFFLDLAIEDNWPDVMAAVSAMEKRSIWLRFCGAYPVSEAKI